LRFVKFGDENTKLFQAMATHSNRKNSIAELYTESGVCLIVTPRVMTSLITFIIVLIMHQTHWLIKF
jgi:hypothetical protein